MLGRLLRHLCWPEWRVRRHLPRAALDDIGRAITTTEREHRGELRLVIENALDPVAIAAGLGARERALQVFAQLRIWDTEDNCGVLVYLLFAEHAVEIVADRGIAKRVPQADWDAICAEVRAACQSGRYRDGALCAVERVSGLLRRHFPVVGARSNELPDQPVLL
ncbi:MAG: hypothetical protein RL026_2390 [Pseudomonadota bacterium]